jgi:MFS transporter, NNP family, nitrate/nitrite transporter
MSVLAPEQIEKSSDRLEFDKSFAKAIPTEFVSPRIRVLILSTLSFTVLFAVWLMLGILGLKIKTDTRLMLGDSAIASLSAAEIQVAVESRFEWLLAVAILSGSLLRLHFGIWADKLGGRNLMVMLLLGCSIPTLWMSYAHSFTELFICALLFGLAGNSFSVGIAWNAAWFPDKSKGTALGIFGAGNVGAAGTKMLLILIPTILTMVPVTGYLGGWIPGGWRVVPLMYVILLVIMALAILFFAPSKDRKPGHGRPMSQMVAPLKYSRVWRFGFYYVVVFGAYVALSAWLPNYYVNTYRVDLRTAAILTSLFILPASLLRPVGGWLSDIYGPRIVTYLVFISIALASIPLSLPTQFVSLGVGGFTTLMIVVGVAMGIGKASVYKYIPNYFPRDVGAVGGLVGALGALGGFILPKLFGWLGRSTGYPQAAFIALILLSVISLCWLHKIVLSLREQQLQPNKNVVPVDDAIALGSQSEI